MTDSKNGSKSNLNESNMPLLDDDNVAEKTEKEQIELTDTDKAKNEKENKKKAKKEAKEAAKLAKKEAKEKKEPRRSCIDNLTQNLDLGNRDVNSINTEIDLGFDDVLAEPLAAQGFEGVWKLSYVVFSVTKLWFYRVFSAVLAVPLALLWGIVFAFITISYVWALAPVLRIVDLAFVVLRKVWNGLTHATIEPVFRSFGAVFSKMSVSQQRHIIHDA